MSAVLKQEGFISVSPLTDEYEGQVIELGRQMHQESLVHRHMDYDDEKVLRQIRSPETNPDMYFKIAVLNDEVVGMLNGVSLTVYFGADRVAKDLAIFVKPEWRLSRAAFLLVKDFEAWAKTRGCGWTLLSQSTGLNIEKTTRFYKLMGYEPMGVTAWKKLT